MFAGPIIAREVLTAPRPIRFYVVRASYVGILFILMWTAWQSLVGWREVRDFGTLARFGGVLYFLFALLQLTLILFFAPLFTALPAGIRLQFSVTAMAALLTAATRSSRPDTRGSVPEPLAAVHLQPATH